MATIQIYKYGTDTKLGSGDGSIDSKNGTAMINSWTDKPGLVKGTEYKLKSGGKIYSDATCSGVASNDPVATFDKVS